MLLKVNTVSILAKLCLHCDGAVLCVVCPSDEETAILHLPQSTILGYSEVLLLVMETKIVKQTWYLYIEYPCKLLLL